MKNNTNNNVKVKVTTLGKNLLLNAQYTDKSHFIGKSIGEKTFAEWQKALKDLKHNAFEYYEALAEERENIADFEKSVYTSIKALLSIVGEVPTKEDETVTSKINSSVLFFDSVKLAVKEDSKVEVNKLVKAREALRQAKMEYRKNCLTEDGIVKNGLTEAYITKYAEAIKTATAEVEKLLKVKGNSVFGTEEVKLGTFAKKFEICLRKAMLKQYHWTVKEVKQTEQKQKQTRKANRNKADKKTNK